MRGSLSREQVLPSSSKASCDEVVTDNTHFPLISEPSTLRGKGKWTTMIKVI